MKKIGIIREEKTPQDNRVPFSPKQCAWLLNHYPNLDITVQPSPHRAFTNDEYIKAGIKVAEDISHCDIFFGVKEVKIDSLLPNKTYLFFSHTKKKQAANKPLMQALINKKITMIDYECLVHDDGQRVVGFGFFAGVVGAHNGIMTYGKKTGKYNLTAVHKCKNFQDLIHTYFGLKLPNIKIVITGSGRVAAGLLEIMSLLDFKSVDPFDYLTKSFSYPVFVHLKGQDLYRHKELDIYKRDHFHTHPEEYKCEFLKYAKVTDILMNGIYWDSKIPRLFELEDVKKEDFKVSVISDVTCDINGSVPTNIYVTTIADPVYGFDRTTFQKVEPYQNNSNSIDMMTVDNLPNELPRDASKFFGEFLEKYVMQDLLDENHESAMLHKATICKNGTLNEPFAYLSDYAYN